MRLSGKLILQDYLLQYVTMVLTKIEVSRRGDFSTECLAETAH
jgi:hypothetical protein